MQFTTLRIAGAEALRVLEERRSRYPATGEYPFLIGDDEELERIKEAAEDNERAPEAIIQSSLGVRIADWIAARRKEAEESEFAETQALGRWPARSPEAGSISLHKDVLSGELKPQVVLGLARIKEPWQLPAILRYGGWNECPEAEVQCAFHRDWQQRFGAEIAGMSGDVVECIVRRPPADRAGAIALAWEQYWYCADIVEQGCGSVSNLAATLVNSPYWYFWWD